MAYFAYSNPRSFAPDCINQNSEDITAKGIIQNINVATDYGDVLYLPGQSSSIPASDIGVLFQGYFKPPVDGYFTFTTTSATDDYGWIWIGSKAFTGWTGSNCDAFSAYTQHSGSVTFDLAEGEMLPVTVLWGNHLGPGHLDFEIFSSSLNQVLTDTTGLFLVPLEFDEFPYPMPTPSRTLTLEDVSPTVTVPSSAPTKTVTTTVYANNVPESTTTVTGDDAQETITVTHPYGMAYNVYISPYTPDKDGNWEADFNTFGAGWLNFNSDENTLLTCGIATGDINFEGSGYSKLPGQNAATDFAAIAIVYHGYFLAPTTGTYSFIPFLTTLVVSGLVITLSLAGLGTMSTQRAVCRRIQ